MSQNSAYNCAIPSNQRGSVSLRGGGSCANTNSSNTLIKKNGREFTGMEVAEQSKKGKLTILAEHLVLLPWQIARAIE